jgi:hypothetical protein
MATLSVSGGWQIVRHARTELSQEGKPVAA